MTRPTPATSFSDSTSASSSQRLGAVDREALLSNGSSAVACLARLLGRLAAKACAEAHHSKQAKEPTHE